MRLTAFGTARAYGTLRWPSPPPGTRDSAAALLQLGAQAGLALADLGRGVVAEVVHLVERSQLQDAPLAGHGIRAAPRPRQRLPHRFPAPDPEAGDQLLGFGERSVHHLAVAARQDDALSVRAGLEAVAGQHDARLDELL